MTPSVTAVVMIADSKRYDFAAVLGCRCANSACQTRIVEGVRFLREKLPRVGWM
ncbi:MAG: hypothetical protein JWM55_196 [Acidimicrobiaceae bacterium]|nr:hypothetical protein [Acidimicrobiaceae bacterium]